jgi:23S rRNA (guanine745-N1)-methyltransferase
VDAALRCEAGHSFDLAREGYVNLLRPGRAAPAELGDSREMLAVRREFLAAGHYEPLTRALLERVEARLPADGRVPVVADFGCGEGHVLRALAERFGARIRRVGLDASKHAVRLAARADPAAALHVADLWDTTLLPDASVDIALSVLAPRSAAEFARVIAPHGCIVLAAAGPGHLESLRREHGLIDQHDPEQRELSRRLAGGFALQAREALEFELRLSGPEAEALVRMSPLGRHADAAALAAIRVTGEVRTRAAFALLEFVATSSA